VTDWLPVAELSALTRRRKMQVFVGDEPVALFLVGEDVFALADTCIHKQRSLSKGALLNGRIVCPGHQWEFDPETGYVQEQDRCQPTYEVTVADGTILVAAKPREAPARPT
jgi:nitrite reductase (NADH) small subunit